MIMNGELHLAVRFDGAFKVYGFGQSDDAFESDLLMFCSVHGEVEV